LQSHSHLCLFHTAISSMRWRVALLAAGASSAAAGALYAWPTYAETVRHHRDFTASDLAAIRDVSSGSQIAAERNPGVRMFPAFLEGGQTGPVLRALQALKRDCGINLIDPAHAAIYRFVRRRLGSHGGW
jgi:hypothetical protein